MCGDDAARGRSATSASPRAGTSRTRTPATAATSSTSSTAPRTGPTSVDARAARAVRARASSGCARPRRQGAARLERAVPRARSPRPRPRSTATTGWTPRARTPRFLLARAAPRRRPAAALVAGRPCRPLAYAEDYAALLEALLTLAELDDVAWLAEARAVADELAAPVRRRRAAAASSPPAPTPRRSSCGRRTSRTTRRRRRTRSPPTACSGWRRSPATPLRRPARGAVARARWRPCSASTPPRSRTCSGRSSALVQPPIEVAIVGDAGADRDRARRRAAHPRAPGIGAGHRRARRRRRPDAPARRPRRSSTASRRPTCASASPAGCPVTDAAGLRAELDARR